MSIKQRIIFSNSIGFNLGCKKLRIIARKKITHSFIKRAVKQYAYKRVPEKIFQNERVLFKWRVFKLKFDEFWSDHQTKQQRNNYLENWQKNDILWKLYRWDYVSSKLMHRKFFCCIIRFRTIEQLHQNCIKIWPICSLMFEDANYLGPLVLAT